MTTRLFGAWAPGPIRYQKKPAIASRPRPATSMPVIAPERNAMVRPPWSDGARRLGGADIGLHRDVHADEAGDAREQRADQEADRGDQAEEIEDEGGDDHADDGDRHILAGEIGARALLHGSGDVLHPLVAGRRFQHLHDGDEAVEHGEQAAADGDEHDVHDLPLRRIG